MMEGSAMHMSMLHQESAEQEKKDLMKDMPVDDKASAMEMSPYKMDHGSPAEFTGMSGGSALHQEKKPEVKKDSVVSIPEKKKDSFASADDKNVQFMKKLQGLNIRFDSGAEKPKEQIKKQLEK